MNYQFGKSSMAKLETCDERLQEVLKEALKYSHLDMMVLEGMRSIERQQRLFRDGKSKIDGITKKGKHNHSPSLAVDVCPYPVDWNDLNRFYLQAGTILTIARTMDVQLRWGGDWDMDGDFRDQTFNDLPHFELRT